MKLHDELINRGFTLLDSSTKTYGYDKDKLLFTGSIENERKGKIIFMTPEDKIQSGDKEVFCPFINTEDDKRPNKKYQSVILKNSDEIDKYIIERIEIK